MKLASLKASVLEALLSPDASWNLGRGPEIDLPLLDVFFDVGPEFRELNAAVAKSFPIPPEFPRRRGELERTAAVELALFSIYTKDAKKGDYFYFPPTDLHPSASITADRIIEIAEAIWPQFDGRAGPLELDLYRVRDAALARINGWRVAGEKPRRADIAVAYDVLRWTVLRHVDQAFDWLQKNSAGFPPIEPTSRKFSAQDVLDHLLNDACPCRYRGLLPPFPDPDTLRGNAKRIYSHCRNHHWFAEFEPSQISLDAFLKRAVQGTPGVFADGMLTLFFPQAPLVGITPAALAVSASQRIP